MYCLILNFFYCFKTVVAGFYSYAITYTTRLNSNVGWLLSNHSTTFIN